MTTTTHTSPTRTDDRALVCTGALALLSGTALVVDTVTIAVINRSFDPLDSVLFLIGFAGLWLTGIALAVHLSGGLHGPTRALAGLGYLLATAAVLGVIGTAFDQLGRHVFSASNKGLHGEWSFFSIGVCLLLIALWAARGRRRHA